MYSCLHLATEQVISVVCSVCLCVHVTPSNNMDGKEDTRENLSKIGETYLYVHKSVYLSSNKFSSVGVIFFFFFATYIS